jgi:CO/xanthine dehydrogenase FAD-binding subunit
MRTALSSLSLKRPRSLAQALALMRGEEPLTPLAGCTDVYVNLQFGTARETRFIDLWPLEELRGISADKHTLRIGALNTYSDIIASSAVRKRLPMLVAAAREIGGRQIQNRGTLAGNIANASPAGDALPVLAAADAIVVLASADGERRVPLTSFYTGYRTSVRRDDELIVAIDIPRAEGRQFWRKVGTRRAQAISKVMMAGIRGSSVRLAVGSVAPTVLRLSKTEQALSSGASLTEAIRVLAQEITPIDDIRSTADYRRRVTANLLESFWNG